MSQEMRSWKQRSLDIASRSTTSLRGHLAQRDIRIPTRRELQPGDRGYVDGTPNQKQSWSQWVGEKVSNARRGQSDDAMSAGVDEVVLFPGWATRRYQRAGTLDDSFGMDVFVSGYASNHRPPEFATRSQKAFLRLAKGFAALPKLQLPHREEEDQPVLPVSRSTEELLASIHLPPRPTEISVDYESQQVEALEEGFRHLGDEDGSETASNISHNSSSSDVSAANPPVSPFPSSPASSLTSDARKLHTNLESRLQPFWSTTLSSRTIRLSLFASPHNPALSESQQAKEPGWDGLDHGPVATQEVITSSDGSFQAKFSVSWEDMCQHPGALHIAFGDPTLEHDLLVSAELLPPSILQLQTRARPQTSLITQRISLTYSPVRVISDIDDTVKLSNILSGARAVFHNVFVKEMRDIVIPGMGEWYNEMWRRGVRFHYVSNGPFELIPVVNEFFEVSRLPPGSVRLKSYAGRSLFNGLLSAPATRKRAGILDILDNFLDSRFILIGDTGEQDLELYAAIARDRPQQISGVFVRDVGAYDNGLQGLEDPTGLNINIALPRSATKDADAMFAQTIGPKTPIKRGSEPYPTELPPMPKPPRRSMSDIASTIRAKPTRTLSRLSLTSGNNNGSIISGNFFTSTARAGSPVSSTSSRNRQLPNDIDGSYPPGGFLQDTTNMTEQERKRIELQMRVYKARAQIPPHVYLRVFRKAEECIEASEILDALHAESN